ncbi:MAG: DUF192 domain-containing protein [Candidatus Omnitrophota bacterium]|nr:DUF192 domain-containing protein [Candidatus Omnitrophota bacterium]
MSGCYKGPFRKVCIDYICVQAEIVDSVQERGIGLMFRERLLDNRAMLFVFDKEAQYSFWMENMKFPLDIIWINRNKKIVDIRTNVLPCGQRCKSLLPQYPAQYVLEVCAGFADRYQVKVGQQVNF